jgi:hypothetical protein
VLAPAIFVQLAPVLSQTCHWYEVEVGLPVQLPAVALSCRPSVAVPLILGSVVFVGAAGAGAVTLAVVGELIEADPPSFEAVTVTRIVSPTSL